MGTQTKEVGGGPAVGLANDFVKFLQSGLNSGTFGGATAATGAMNANPYASTSGIAGILNDILSGGAGNLGGSLQEMISKQGERDVNAVRSRFGVGGGTAFGTPAAYAESMVRSETAPKLATAVGGLQLQALSPLLSILAGLSSKGITQRETIQQPSELANAFGIAAPVIGAIAGGPIGGAIGGKLGGMFGGGIVPPGTINIPQPNVTLPPVVFPGMNNFIDPRVYGGQRMPGVIY